MPVLFLFSFFSKEPLKRTGMIVQKAERTGTESRKQKAERTGMIVQKGQA
jgi:hypothetical protein